jgi:hypothetical protein
LFTSLWQWEGLIGLSGPVAWSSGFLYTRALSLDAYTAELAQRASSDPTDDPADVIDRLSPPKSTNDQAPDFAPLHFHQSPPTSNLLTDHHIKTHASLCKAQSSVSRFGSIMDSLTLD